jgi:WD40 repeat protein
MGVIRVPAQLSDFFMRGNIPQADRTVPAGGGEPRAVRAKRHAVHQVNYSPDGEHLTSYSEDGTVYVWDMTNHQLCATLQGRFQWPCCLAPSGKELVSGGKDGTLSMV